MTKIRQPRYSTDELERRGDAIYEGEVRSQVEGGHDGEFVAIDIDSSDWELDSEALKAINRLIERRPDCQAWLVRVGHPYVHRLGGHRHQVAS